MNRKGQKTPTREYTYYLDKEGIIYMDGTEVEDPRFYNLVHRKLQHTGDGRFLAVCQGERCYLQVEDVPYVVIDLEVLPRSENRSGDMKKGLEGLVIVFRGDYREALDPSTLFVGKDNVLYCQVRNGSFEARFARNAYYDLANYIEYDSNSAQFCLKVASEKYPVIKRPES
jgi:uncharacterized protein